MTLPRLILPDSEQETVAAGVLGIGLWKKLVAQLKLLGGGSRKQVIEHDGYEVMVEASHQHGQDSGRVRVSEKEFVSFVGLPDPTRYRFLSVTYEDLSTQSYVDAQYRLCTSDGESTFLTVTPRVWPQEIPLYSIGVWNNLTNFYERCIFLLYGVKARGDPIDGHAIPTGIHELQNLPDDLIVMGEEDLVACDTFPDNTFSGEDAGQWLIRPIRYDPSRSPCVLDARSAGEIPVRHEWDGKTVVTREEEDGGTSASVRFNQTPVRQLGVGRTFVLNGTLRWIESNKKVSLTGMEVESSPLMSSEPVRAFRDVLIEEARNQVEVHGNWWYNGLLKLLDPTLEAKRLHSIKLHARTVMQSTSATERVLDLLRKKELPVKWNEALESVSRQWLPDTGYFKYKPRIEYGGEGTAPHSPFTTRLKLEFEFDWGLEEELPVIPECEVIEVGRGGASRVVRCSQLIEGKAEDTSPSSAPLSELKYTNVTSRLVYRDLGGWWAGLVGDSELDNNEPGTVGVLSPFRVYNGYADRGASSTSWQEGVKRYSHREASDESGFQRYKNTRGEYTPPYLREVRLTSKPIEGYSALFKYGSVLTDKKGHAEATQSDPFDWERLATEILRARLKVRLVLFGPKDGGLFSDPVVGKQTRVYGVLDLKYDASRREWAVQKWVEPPSPVTIDAPSGSPTLYHNFLAMKDDAWMIGYGTVVSGFGKPLAPSDNRSWINAVALVRGGRAPGTGVDWNFSVDYSKTDGFVGEVLRAAGVIPSAS